MATEHLFHALRFSLQDSFTSSKYSDLIVRCEDQEFKVHKIIVCGQSKFFSSICDGSWKEAKDGIIELKDDNVRAVEAMLHFMYTADYDGTGNDEEGSSDMIFNAEVYSIGDKYEIQALKVRAKEKFDKAVETCWDTDDFPHSIIEVYNSTPFTDRGLRDTVVDVAHIRIGALLKKDGFQGVLEETVGFAADVVRRMARSEAPSIQKYQCPDCRIQFRAALEPGGYYSCQSCNYARSDWASYTMN